MKNVRVTSFVSPSIIGRERTGTRLVRLVNGESIGSSTSLSAIPGAHHIAPAGGNCTTILNGVVTN